MGGREVVLAAGLLAGCTGEVDVYLVDTSDLDGAELVLDSASLPLDEVDVLRDGEWLRLARGPDPYNLLDFSGEPSPIDLVALHDQPARLAQQEIGLGEIARVRLWLMPDMALRVVAPGASPVEATIEVMDAPPWEVDVAAAVTTDDEASTITIGLDVRSALTATADGYRFRPLFSPEE